MPTIRMTSAEADEFERLARERGGSVGAMPSAPAFADEAAFMAAVVRTATANGWVVYHTFDSRRSVPGFPDLVMIRGPALLAVECKRSKREQPTAAQKKWLAAFQGVPGATVGVWSPEMWAEIVATLTRP